MCPGLTDMVTQKEVESLFLCAETVDLKKCRKIGYEFVTVFGDGLINQLGSGLVMLLCILMHSNFDN